SNHMLQARGYAPYDFKGGRLPKLLFDEHKGIRFTSLFKIKNSDGSLLKSDSTLGIRNATEAEIYISTATSFNGFDKNPATEGKNDEAIAAGIQKKISQKTFQEIKVAHIKDYQKYFNRVSLNLGDNKLEALPTDQRLKRYSEGNEDRALEALYFQFGRYLLISSSRTPNVPANLQGIWNPYLYPPWQSNYTVNINLEENYWPAEPTNLAEMTQPLVGFISNLSKTGKATAHSYYGIKQGWASCHTSDIWAMSNPDGEGKGSPQWANWNMSGTWLCTHLWEHYAFSLDTAFLKNTAYPLMKGAAQFCLAWLVEGPNGYMLVSPSVSPEDRYLTPDGYKGFTLYGPTGDIELIRACFEETISASQILKVDEAFRASLIKALARLYPFKVGKMGNLQEWYHDWGNANPHDQNELQLFGLYPGHQITPEKTPELAAACRKTLEIKGDQTKGWGTAWRIGIWARLYDGNYAYKMYKMLLQYYAGGGPPKTTRTKGGAYPNLLNAMPPFQIEANFGGTAGVAEMLIQSSENEIKLLPALPDAWSSGEVKGLCARGGFVVSMKWQNKVLEYANVFSKRGGNTTVTWGGKSKKITLGKGQQVVIKNMVDSR
ncbi:MAG: glycoside hydrolase family 95 protein, partial [Bacteroidota bacterium]|nr:glycoside hydrolase family 95 protein [Bacteroidota bacterium]